MPDYTGGNETELVDGAAALVRYDAPLTAAQRTAIFAKDADGLYTTALNALVGAIDLGYTTAATAITYSQTVRERMVQQKSESVKTRRTGRGITIGTSLGQYGQDNFVMAVDAERDAVTGRIVPKKGSDVTEFPIVVELPGINDLSRRLLVHRASNTAEVVDTADSGNDSALAVTFTGKAPSGALPTWELDYEGLEEDGGTVAPAPAP